MEKTNLQDKKSKGININHGSQKNLQKTNSEDSAIVKVNEPVNKEMDTTTKSDVDTVVKPLNNETTENSLKPE